MPRNTCGRPVRGENFYDRADEREALWNRLESDHLMLSAPRRVGKTSLMYRLLEDVRGKPEWVAGVYFSAEDAREERDFVLDLYAEVAQAPGCEAVAERLQRGRLGKAIARVSSLSVGALSIELREHAPEDWTVLATELEEALHALPPGRRLLIMVDELPVFLLALLASDRTRATDFLRWFRQLRQGPASRSDDVRWLVAGSIGLAPLARRERWSAQINDLLPVTLGAFSDEVSDTFLAELAAAHGITIDPAVSAAIREDVGWAIPFYLQLYVSGLRDLRVKRPTLADVTRVREGLQRTEAAKHFAPWRERLDDELGATDAAAARAVLDACAVDPHGITPDTVHALLARFYAELEREERRRWLLEVLEGDGYLVPDEGRWRFRSPVLRRAWVARSAR